MKYTQSSKDCLSDLLVAKNPIALQIHTSEKKRSKKTRTFVIENNDFIISNVFHKIEETGLQHIS